MEKRMTKQNEVFCTAVVLSAGRGKRMGTRIEKQYLELEGRQIIYYALKAFEDSPLIDEIILVVGGGQISFAQKEIVQKYELKKVTAVIEGGKERYDSVWNALRLLGERGGKEGYVFIHDGARPFVDEGILSRTYEAARTYGACTAGMPVKDTIKIADEEQMAKETPRRDRLWMIQTPQVFQTELIGEAYERLQNTDKSGITDDAMVVEQMMGRAVRLVEGSYENIKITTPEDLEIAKVFLKKRRKGPKDR